LADGLTCELVRGKDEQTMGRWKSSVHSLNKCGVSRTEDLWYAVASLQRNLVPNASLRLSMKYEDQDSSRETFSFDRLTAEIGFKVVF
jgi:hypothetical protein|tara:strand:+ start:100 stop:363 length:264 start_codon:yes stop_codon:yes gene_type:complete